MRVHTESRRVTRRYQGPFGCDSDGPSHNRTESSAVSPFLVAKRSRSVAWREKRGGTDRTWRTPTLGRGRRRLERVGDCRPTLVEPHSSGLSSPPCPAPLARPPPRARSALRSSLARSLRLDSARLGSALHGPSPSVSGRPADAESWLARRSGPRRMGTETGPRAF